MGAEDRETAADYITEALLLLMKKKEYQEITITELCAKAGVTRMSFYRNFASKEDVLRQWMTDLTDRFVRSSAISYQNDEMEEYFLKLFHHMARYREICTALDRAGMLYLVKDQFDRVFLTVYRGKYDEYKSYFLSGGIYNVFLLWLRRGWRESPEQLAERLADIWEK